MCYNSTDSVLSVARTNACRLIISYVYTTTESECSGSRPTVRLSTRHHSGSGGRGPGSPGGPMNSPASYSNWNLAWVYTGKLLVLCRTTEPMNVAVCIIAA